MSSSTVINGFHVVIDDDGECIISKGDYKATIDFICEEGYLCGKRSWEALRIDDDTIDLIVEFAQMMGYTGE